MLTPSLMRRTNSTAISRLLAFLVALVTGSSSVRALDLGKCQTALGMQTGEILDSALTASSSIDLFNMGPTSARIRSEIRGGAWCPKEPISKDSYEFLEIDLRRLHVISLVETQGRFGNGQGQEYTEQFRLEFQRQTDGKWFRFRNRREQEIIQGNVNTHTAEMREILPPIIAQKIRFIPHSTHPKTACLRVELYGCLSPDGVVAYEMPQGEQRGQDLNFADSTYDGTDQNGYLTGGLGQLLDGEEGQTNFRVDYLGFGLRGYEWIGWRNDSFPNGFLEIVFTFDNIRNFTNASLHCNNMFLRDVRVFSMARIYFGRITSSPDERTFDASSLEFVYERDDLIDYARRVTIPLNNRIGMFVKIQLFFDAKWLMISEVQFVSEVVKVDSVNNHIPVVNKLNDQLQTITVTPGGRLLRTDHFPAFSFNTSTNPLRGNLNAFESHTSENRVFSHDVVKNVTVGGDTFTSWNVSRLQNKTGSGLDDESVVIIITVLVVVVLTLCAVIIIVAFKRAKHSCVHHRFPSDSKTSKPAPSIVGDASNSSYGPQLITFSNTSGLLEQNVLTHSYLAPSLQPDSDEQEQSDTTSPLISSPLCFNPYATVDILNVFDCQNREQTGKFCTLPRKSERTNMVWTTFPPENLKFIRSLGEGQTGEVYLCELVQQGSGKQYGTHSSMRTSMTRPPLKLTLVAVKMVSKNASDQEREDFLREAAAMSRFDDPNIVQLLGICTNSDPCYTVLEYPHHGDLKKFLQNCVIEGSAKRDQKHTLSYGCLIYMATQIASGMKFLESRNLVHRDLSARNCLVGEDYVVKVSDFHIGHSQYPTDYYINPGNEPLPVRWMAWEALRLSNFSTKSDIWSFAVTMWEMLTFARQPYEAFSNEQVIINSNHLLQNPGLWVALDQPVLCPREIYDLLCHCWSREKSQRPTFHEIHMFLQRKNAGYHPGRDRCTINGAHTKASVSLFV